MAKEKRKYADRAEYLKKAVDKRRKMIRKMAVNYKMVNVPFADIRNALKLLIPIIFHHQKKTLGFPKKDIPEVGKE